MRCRKLLPRPFSALPIALLPQLSAKAFVSSDLAFPNGGGTISQNKGALRKPTNEFARRVLQYTPAYSAELSDYA